MRAQQVVKIYVIPPRGAAGHVQVASIAERWR